jgi:hypothetical protein
VSCALADTSPLPALFTLAYCSDMKVMGKLLSQNILFHLLGVLDWISSDHFYCRKYRAYDGVQAGLHRLVYALRLGTNSLQHFNGSNVVKADVSLQKFRGGF